MTCVFCKIVNGEIPSKTVLSDEHAIAFHDITPRAPVHVLVVPRRHIESLADTSDADRDLLGRLVVMAGAVANTLGIAEAGYRVIANTRGHGGQEVPHLHFHVLGGRRLGAMVAKIEGK